MKVKKEIPVIYYTEDEEAYYYSFPDVSEKNGRKEITVLKKMIQENEEYGEENILNMRFYVPGK